MYRSASVRVANRYLRLKTANSLNSTETQFLDFVSKAIQVIEPKVSTKDRNQILSSAIYQGSNGLRETKMRWSRLKSSFDSFVARSLVRGKFLTEAQIVDFGLHDRQFDPTLEKSVEKEIGGAFFKFSRVVLEDPLYRTTEPYQGDTYFYESEYLKIPVSQRPAIEAYSDKGNVSFTIELVAVRASLVLDTPRINLPYEKPTLLDTPDLSDDANEQQKRDHKRDKKLNRAVVEGVLRQLSPRIIRMRTNNVPVFIADILDLKDNKKQIEAILDEIAKTTYLPTQRTTDNVVLYAALRNKVGHKDSQYDAVMGRI